MNIITYWIELRTLHKEKEQIHKNFKDVEPFKPDPEEHPGVFMMDPEYEFELRLNEDKVQALMSQYIIKKAETLH